jgi:recombination protein RecA
MAGNVATLRSRVETALAGRVPAPFTCRDFRVETAPFDVPEMDGLTGGLPRGSLTEICGPPCSGRTTLLLSVLAARTAHGEVCALVDGRDGFDPHTAQAAGVNLEQLLWVRCRTIDQALRATDLLIQGGGFGLIALDLSDISEKTVRGVPLSAWFRFRRAVENTSTILLLLDQEPNARTCASLVLRLSSEPARWSATPLTQTRGLPCACLFDGSQIRAELLRSRLQPAIGTRGRHDFAPTGESGSATIFETRISWGFISAA